MWSIEFTVFPYTVWILPIARAYARGQSYSSQRAMLSTDYYLNIYIFFSIYLLYSTDTKYRVKKNEPAEFTS